MTWHHHQRGVVCPMCGKERPPKWNYTEAIMIGGRPVPEDVAEAALAHDPDAEIDKFYDSDALDERGIDAVERNLALAASGNLAPMELPNDENSRKVLAEQSEKFVQAIKE